ncbi:MAG: SDR family NAD(P)-dependent oxidoreductase [Chloroflexota bacterium]|nr:SDR family NAD(P)-dependent oxidoreductase [Chloroflexota bacterium]
MTALDPVMVVTGGSRGIGAATSFLGAARGYRVAIGFHESGAEAETVVRGIHQAGGKAKAFPLDVADPGSVERFFSEIERDMGQPQALVNGAGITGGVCGVLDLNPDIIGEVVAVNLLGTFYCMRAAALRMSRARGGSGGAIVNISSEAARFGGNCMSAYASAKAGINTLTVAVARELAGDGIRINAVSPGVIDTDQNADLSPDGRESLVGSIPLKRMGQPEEVAEAILWLLSGQASYVTGSILSVNGGR